MDCRGCVVLALACAASSAACYREENLGESSGTAASGSSGGSTITTNPSTTDPSTTTSAAEATTADTSGSSSASSTGDTDGGETCVPPGRPMPPSCGDGNATPGELCFAPFVAYPAAGVGSELVLADHDADDDLDVLAAVNDASTGNALTIRFNEGGELAAEVGAPGSPSGSLAVAAFDASPGLDAVVAHTTAQGILYSGPELAPGGSLSFPAAALVRAAEMNGGPLDLVVASGAVDYIDVFVGDGNGSFTPDPAARTLLNEGEVATALAVANVGGGDSPDMVVATSDNRVVVVRNPYGMPGVIDVAPGDASVVQGLAVGNVFGDDAPEIVVAFPEGVRTFASTPDGTRWNGLEYKLPGGARDVAIADMNRDLIPDIVAIGLGASHVAVIAGVRGSALGDAYAFDLPQSGGCNRLALGRFDDDCVLDVATVCSINPQIVLLRSDP